MIRLTVEEMNLLSIYHEGSKAQLMENMTAALRSEEHTSELQSHA